MIVVLDICIPELISLLLFHGFNAIGIENATQIEVTIEPYNAIELQRLALVLEQYE